MQGFGLFSCTESRVSAVHSHGFLLAFFAFATDMDMAAIPVFALEKEVVVKEVQVNSRCHGTYRKIYGVEPTTVVYCVDVRQSVVACTEIGHTRG